MRSFKDKDGVSWDVEVTMQTRAIVSARTGIDLLLMGQGDQHTFDLLVDPSRSMEVLLALTEAQRKERKGMTPEAFGNALNSEELSDAALDAVLNSTFDFFPRAQGDLLRKTMLTLLEIRREDAADEIAKAMERVNAPDFKEKLRAKLKEKSTDSQESSASTPAPLPGGNLT